MNDLVLLCAGALLTLAGAVVQVFITRAHSVSDRQRELLIDAYNEYLTGIAKRASILHEHSQRTEEATSLMFAGRQKISAYAPMSVVACLAKLESTNMSLSDQVTQTAMVELVAAMRQSVGVNSQGADSSIASALFSGVKVESPNRV
ncbi:MAG: hypothetical protein AAF608_03010 [Pseudomonadota bacterium]